jgi:putative phosphoesterase
MTRIAVMADIHSNLPAYQEIMKAIAERKPDMYLIAGDIVGYNPFPNEVLAELMRVPKKNVIMGNHDRATVTGNTQWFNNNAAEAIRWTRKSIKNELYMKFLSTRKEKERLRIDGKYILICHGTPWDPDEYVLPAQVHEDLLTENRVDVLIMGHTHIAFAKNYTSGVILNPGAVGQPRDGDPRASAAILDLEEMEVEKIRVEYDIDKVANAITKAGLPESLAQRLYYGA